MKFSYSEHVFGMVALYSKLLGFGEKGGSSHNNEADAFKHTYMSAEMTCIAGYDISKNRADYHETKGNKKGQPKGEYYMDLWNNEIGRQIGLQVRKEFGFLSQNLSHEQRIRYYDRIAELTYLALKRGY
ncbi:MAG: hypothetical protein NC200_08525, partial [Candidatus Gastranaerophilales bacterium]|nr:hypothetical protein [Candidatus Gastranaerophilales bacterium]